MSNTTFGLDERLRRYVLQHSLREHPLLEELRAVTRQDAHARYQISPEQGQFMALLVQAIGARRCIEIGTYTGYSALVVALALPEDGRIVCCDISREWTAIAERYWARAGVAHKIDLRIAPALDTLSTPCWTRAMPALSISRSSTPTRKTIPLTTSAASRSCGPAA